MWVSYENIWLFYVGGLGLILFLYVAKAVVLKYVRQPSSALAYYLFAVGLCVPIAWGLSPDWNNWNVRRISNYVGTPIIIVTIPLISFLFDLYRKTQGTQKSWYWRIPLEILVLVPVWFYFWVFFELLVLGWVWI
ncbi:MAG TPA: hypothetical protein PLN21_07635 [Gemmatales bacterium]|nr:hypothetical protein [Gemmatales bacterium]